MGTRLNPPPFDCYNNALPHEETFTLLARDESAPAVLRFWVLERIKRNKNKWSDPQIVEAQECARRMEEQHAQIRADLEAQRSR